MKPYSNKYMKKNFSIPTYSCTVKFDENYFKDSILTNLIVRYFSNCLYETIMEDKENEEFKQYIKEEYNKMLKKEKKERQKNLKNKNIHRNSLRKIKNIASIKDYFCKKLISASDVRGLLRINISGEKYFIYNISKYIQSKEFKEKFLKTNLNKDYFNKLKNLKIKDMVEILNSQKDSINKIKEKNSFQDEKYNIEKNLKNNEKKLENIKDFEDTPEEIEDIKNNIEYYKKQLENPEKLKLEKETVKDNSIKNQESMYGMTKKDIYKLKQIRYETFNKIIKLHDTIKIKLNKNSYLDIENKIEIL